MVPNLNLRFALGIPIAILLSLGVVACSDGSSADTAEDEPTRVVLDGSEETPVAQNPTSEAAPQETPAPPSLPTGGIPGSDEPPSTMATAGGSSVEMGIGTYCWTRLCVDKSGIITKGTLTVASGDTVAVEVPQSAPTLSEMHASVFPATNATPLASNEQVWPYGGPPETVLEHEIVGGSAEITVDLEPGLYVLVVAMFFEGGDVVYGAVLDVQ